MRKATLSLLVWGLCGIVSSYAAQAQFETPKEPEKETRARFLEVLRITNLPFAAQKRELPHVYRDLLPHLYLRMNSAADPAERDEAARIQTEPPEQIATEILQRGGWVAVHDAARDVCLQLLANHIQDLQPLLLASL